MQGIIAVIIGFFSAAFGVVIKWLLTAAITGTLRSAALYLSTFLVVTGLVYAFVNWVNDQLIALFNTANPITQQLVSSWLSFLPGNLPYLVTVILGYYATSAVFHIAVEIKKYQHRAMIESTKSFKA